MQSLNKSTHPASRKWYVYGVLLCNNILFISQMMLIAYFNTNIFWMIATSILMICFTFIIFTFFNIQQDKAVKKSTNGFQDRDDLVVSSVDKIGATNVLFFDDRKSNSLSYYPLINDVALPLFSSKLILNPYSLIVIATFSIIFYIVTSLMMGLSNHIHTMVLALTAFGFNTLYYVFIHRRDYFDLIQHLKHGDEPNIAYMRESKRDIENYLKERDFDHLIPVFVNNHTNRILKTEEMAEETSPINKFKDAESPKPNRTLFDIYLYAVHLTNLLNAKIIEGVISPDSVENEIKTLNYINNSYIRERIGSIEKFLEQHNSNKEIAEKVFMQDISPKIIDAINSFGEKLDAIEKSIIEVEALYKKNMELSIRADESFKDIFTGGIVQLPFFPEFKELEFDSLKNEVAAKNIAIESLPVLYEALGKTTDKLLIEDIEQQIEKIKAFVRSLANNTDEHIHREARLIEDENNNLIINKIPLEVKSEIRNTMQIQDRYMQSYDEILD